ncbi:MAG: GTPase HflX [Gammaproteobacteria bacterium]|nr:MAG: GTPase HflX [Gammaproteobacteria bacterium]
MFERPDSGERAILVHVNFPAGKDAEDLQEFTDLVRSAGALPVATVTATRSTPEPRLFVGQGKADEIHAAVRRHDADIVIFNHALSPSQERNLERLFSCRVIARTGLILDIFAQRARSFEGKLQVELAQLRHLSTRLVRGWTHLERQKGGIGLRGPGETQLESDRRMINARIKMINKRLEKVDRQRNQGRRARNRADIPTVSLVGYTNAGKSTLFNALTGAHAYAADQLFATLDPKLRRIDLPGVGPLVLADTVGFIRHLPHDLVAAFRSTLEETCQAELLLHVVDVQDADRQARMTQVDAVLREIGAADVPQLIVYNKIDLNGLEPRIEKNTGNGVEKVWLSAVTGAGLELLADAMGEFFHGRQVHGWLHMGPEAGRTRSSLYAIGQVISEQVDAQGNWWLEVRMAQRNIDKLVRESGGACQFHPFVAVDSVATAAKAS